MFLLLDATGQDVRYIWCCCVCFAGGDPWGRLVASKMGDPTGASPPLHKRNTSIVLSFKVAAEGDTQMVRSCWLLGCQGQLYRRCLRHLWSDLPCEALCWMPQADVIKLVVQVWFQFRWKLKIQEEWQKNCWNNFEELSLEGAKKLRFRLGNYRRSKLPKELWKVGNHRRGVGTIGRKQHSAKRCPTSLCGSKGEGGSKALDAPPLRCRSHAPWPARARCHQSILPDRAARDCR